MNVSLIMVSSVNGKITNGADPDIAHWTSLEDKQFFLRLKAKQRLIVMGRKTYEASKNRITLTSKTLRIVITKKTDAYRADTVPGQLEFTNESPNKLIKRLSAQGYTKMLLVGGPTLNAHFLKHGLIDLIHLTLEPMLLPTGKNLIVENQPNIQLRLLNVQKLNKRGTLHLTYQVIQ